MSAQTCTTGAAAPQASLSEMAESMKALKAKLEGGDWLLVAPDGRVWAGKRPMQLAVVAMGDCFGPLGFAAQGAQEGKT